MIKKKLIKIHGINHNTFKLLKAYRTFKVTTTLVNTVISFMENVSVAKQSFYYRIGIWD